MLLGMLTGQVWPAPTLGSIGNNPQVRVTMLSKCQDWAWRGVQVPVPAVGSGFQTTYLDNTPNGQTMLLARLRAKMTGCMGKHL